MNHPTMNQVEGPAVDRIAATSCRGGDEIPPGTFHGGDEVPSGTFHGTAA